LFTSNVCWTEETLATLIDIHTNTLDSIILLFSRITFPIDEQHIWLVELTNLVDSIIEFIVQKDRYKDAQSRIQVHESTKEYMHSEFVRLGRPDQADNFDSAFDENLFIADDK
jgi:hypothetical protein